MFLSISSPMSTIFQTLQHYFATGDDLQIIQQYTHNQPSPSLFHTCKGMLFFCNKIFLPEANNFRIRVLRECHESPTAGHSGLKPTLAWVAASFYWSGWTRDVKTFIQQCSPCQRNKYLPKKSQGLIQPLPILDQVWEDLSMDFITHLPSSAGHTVIWVICDRLTKYAHFLVLPTNYTTQSIARRFSSEICRLHGIPKSIVFDRDPIFISNF